MRYYAKTGTPIGCLHPFNPAFYGSMGYGYCNENILYAPKPCHIRSFGDKSGLSYAGPEERASVLAFYRRHAERTHGATVHHFMDPHRIFDAPYVVVCRRAGAITGYLTFASWRWTTTRICTTTFWCTRWSTRIWTRCAGS